MATHSCQRGPSEGCSLCCCPRLAWPALGGAGRSRRWGLLQGPSALSPPACCRCPRTLQQENEPSLLLQQKGWSLAHLPVSRPTLHGDDSTGCQRISLAGPHWLNAPFRTLSPLLCSGQDCLPAFLSKCNRAAREGGHVIARAWPRLWP